MQNDDRTGCLPSHWRDKNVEKEGKSWFVLTDNYVYE